MVNVRSYNKTEDAYLDAAYLGSMGIDVRVVDARGDGGRAVGISEPVIKLDVPDEQLAEAGEWLAKQERSDAVIQPPIFEPSWNTDTLQRFLKALLIFNLAFEALVLLFGHVFYTPPPKEVDAFLESLALSDDLWDFAYISYWPLFALSVTATVLCLFQSKTGRLLFAVSIVWSLLTTLGPPPQIFGPWWNFLSSLAFTSSNIALALMYWSPIRQKFDQRRPSK